MERGFAGKDYHSKAMVVCIDKLTAVSMYDRVQDSLAAAYPATCSRRLRHTATQRNTRG